MDFIKEGKLPEEKKAAKRIKYIFARYVTMEENLYRRGIIFLFCFASILTKLKQLCSKSTKVCVEDTQQQGHWLLK